jgi:hypothetical protein
MRRILMSALSAAPLILLVLGAPALFVALLVAGEMDAATLPGSLVTLAFSIGVLVVLLQDR